MRSPSPWTTREVPHFIFPATVWDVCYHLDIPREETEALGGSSPPRSHRGSVGALPPLLLPGCCLCSSLGISPFLTPTMSISFYGDWDHPSQSGVCKVSQLIVQLNCKTALIPTSEGSWSFAKIETLACPFRANRMESWELLVHFLVDGNPQSIFVGAWNNDSPEAWLAPQGACAQPGPGGPLPLFCLPLCVCVDGWTCLVLGVRWSPPSLDRIHFLSFFFEGIHLSKDLGYSLWAILS